ncbi:hypothetical protein D0Z07_2595 [Hyphodiscus hymeniophilus]|uniref:Uncharacterized protein n=1 Tax=Hyphodiscus hymeniophilus TaxID=353542 RepID=A0A9P6VP98_9HELO|nr:hypothetical protein D0Z07_2595 [Hyphodiscus hymeniophilus]
MSGRIDPFGVLPTKQSPRVHALIYHWVNTLSLFPTMIHSQYCTNKCWLSTAMANPPLFNATLYVASAHLNGLYGQRQSSESMYYKLETIKVLNDALMDPALKTADETIAAVLLLANITGIIGEPGEVDAHLAGLQKMVNLRGGIKSFPVGGVFLHMLCTTNHLSAVLSEDQILVPPTGIPYQPAFSRSPSPVPSIPSFSPILSSLDTPSTSRSIVEESPLLKTFAIECGFHSTLVDVFHDIGFLYSVVDAFTRRLLPSFRKEFEVLTSEIEKQSLHGSCASDEGGWEGQQR